ncbi:MAG: hypothetical protein KAX49_10290 [Halanaerobiales bacterium]|nr:hypothetical protein [Halanaerobiales bacterium]
MNYILLLNKEFDSSNTHFESIIEYKATNDLKVTGRFMINTDYTDKISVKADKVINKNTTFIGEYYKELKNNGYSSLNTGLNFEF